jgi:hypothetical protein
VSAPDGWIVLARFGTRWEADILVEALRAAKIPALVGGDLIGAFGPGFVGAPIRGVEVRVPREFSSRARELRDAFGGPPGEEEPDA